MVQIVQVYQVQQGVSLTELPAWVLVDPLVSEPQAFLASWFTALRGARPHHTMLTKAY